jgi:hypothetical protein
MSAKAFFEGFPKTVAFHEALSALFKVAAVASASALGFAQTRWLPIALALGS